MTNGADIAASVYARLAARRATLVLGALALLAASLVVDVATGPAMLPPGEVARSVLRLSQDLPMVIEIVDSEEKINAFLDAVEPIMGSGLMTLEKVKVVQYGTKRVE